MVSGVIVVLFAVTLGGDAEGPRRARLPHALLPGTSVEGEATTGTTVSHFLDVGAGQYVLLTVEPHAVPIRGGAAPPAASPTTAQPRADLVRAARDAGLGSNSSAFPRLPHSRDEAEAILGAAAPASVLRALDFDASRSTALSSQLADYDIIHFATHGFVDDARPELSGLVLSLVDRAGRPQDGFLRLRDLYGLRLPVELVVLSGCRTGLGKEIRGEGLLGIFRAFMHAGARRVVASVWEVDDRATAAFMKVFYEAMLVSERPPAAALRDAQLALRSRERWDDPFYWAAFAMQGPWN